MGMTRKGLDLENNMGRFLQVAQERYLVFKLKKLLIEPYIYHTRLEKSPVYQAVTAINGWRYGTMVFSICSNSYSYSSNVV